MTASSTDQEPILCRLDRIDNMVKRLEEIRGVGGGGGGRNNNNNNNGGGSPRSSCASTPSFTTSEGGGGGGGSFTDFSPKSMEKHCRPIDDVMVETEHKGTLLQRLDHVEDRVLKLSLELEKELLMEKKRVETEAAAAATTTINLGEEEESKKKKKKKKGLKQLVKSCVPGRTKV